MLLQSFYTTVLVEVFKLPFVISTEFFFGRICAAFVLLDPPIMSPSVFYGCHLPTLMCCRRIHLLDFPLLGRLIEI